jgi:hypothetical protein
MDMRVVVVGEVTSGMRVCLGLRIGIRIRIRIRKDVLVKGRWANGIEMV